MTEPYEPLTPTQLALIADANPAPVLMLMRARRRWQRALDEQRAVYERAAQSGEWQLADRVAFHDRCTAVTDCRDAHELVAAEVVELRRLTLGPGRPR